MSDTTNRWETSRRRFIGAAAAAVPGGLLTKRLAGLAAPQLTLAPMLARPTTSSVLINARNGAEEATATLEITRSDSGERVWQGSAHAQPNEFLEWTASGLKPGTRYRYAIRMAGASGPEAVAARGGFISQRMGEESYVAALITDPHTGTFPEGSAPLGVMDDVIANVGRDNPDFAIGLGDNVAWNGSREQAQTTDDGAKRAYEMYRRHMSPLLPYCPHFSLIGNWDGETGKFPEESIQRVRAVRHRYLPNPDDHTYPQGGNAGQDYYAFTWGPAMYVILNVQSYTKASPPLALPSVGDVDKVEEWTLGRDQMAWLERTLKGSSSPFKFLCIHHTVGGNGGNPNDTLYGRGGARAAKVGEQRIVHQMMLDYGVQAFFFGHDHVFVDDVADGIHYALPGSFGAPWHFPTTITGYQKFWVDSGHARLTVDPKSTVVEYIDQSGATLHSFTVEPKK